jgi:hypothetical protein
MIQLYRINRIQFAMALFDPPYPWKVDNGILMGSRRCLICSHIFYTRGPNNLFLIFGMITITGSWNNKKIFTIRQKYETDYTESRLVCCFNYFASSWFVTRKVLNVLNSGYKKMKVKAFVLSFKISFY